MFRPIPKSIEAGIHVFGLAAFAWSLPLFLVVSGNDAWFLLYSAGRTQAVAFAVVAGVILPALLGIGVSVVAAGFGKRRDAFVSLIVAILSVLAILPNATRLPLPGSGVVLGSVMLGAVVGYYYSRAATVRRFLALLALMAPVYAIWYLANSSLVFPKGRVDTSMLNALHIDSRPPIVVLILDEFSTQTLLNPDRSLNGDAFPSFGRLADDAIWFRNASTIADLTTEAVPAILTGRYPVAGQRLAPTWQNHPRSLFTLLQTQDYDVFASERLTSLCPDTLNLSQAPPPDRWSEIRSFLSDTAIITAHMYLPDDHATSLPPIKGRVGRFAVHDDPADIPFDARHGLTRDLDTPRFREFLSEIDSQSGRLYVCHIVLPHHPYVLLPSGKRMIRLDKTAEKQWMPYISYDESWPENPAIVAGDLQRYLHQAQLVDTLLGELLDRLQANGTYEDAMIVVSADHGVSFRPGGPFRLPISAESGDFTGTNADLDIVKVPVFIKFPGQTEGQINDALLQTVDIVPTILHAMGASNLNWTDGRPYDPTEIRESDSQRFYASTTSTWREHKLNVNDPEYDVASKFALLDFDRGFAPRSAVYDRIAANPPAVIDPATPATFRLVVQQAEDYERVDLTSQYVPAYLRAQVEGEPPPDASTPILIRINGQFGTVSHVVSRHGSPWITAVLEESLFTNGTNELEFFQIESSDNRLVYRPIAWSAD